MEGLRQPDGPATITPSRLPHRDTGVTEYKCHVCGFQCVGCSYLPQCTLAFCDHNGARCESSCCCGVMFGFVIIMVIIVLVVYFTSAVSAPPQPPAV